jgi:hypothetical protein
VRALKLQKIIPLTGYVLFIAGILMASLIHPTIGIATIFGGLLIGMGYENGKQKSRILYYGSFLFLLVLFSVTYLLMIKFLID